MKNGGWITLRYAIITLVGLLISIGFSRWVTKEVYGQYQFILTVISFLSILSLPGLNLVTLRETVKGNEEALLQAVKKSFWWSIGISLCTFLYGGYLWVGGQGALAVALIAAGVLAPFYYSPNNWYVFYEGKKNFQASSLRIIFSQLALLGGGLGALIFGFSLPFLVAFYYLIPAALSGLYFWEVRRQIIRKSHDFHPPKIDTALGIIYTVQKYISSLSEILIVFFVTFLFGFELLAVYQVANMVVLAVVGFLSALLSLYLPHIIEGKKELSLKNIGYSIVAGIPAVLLFLLFLRFFFLPLYGQAYQQSLLLGYALTGIVFFTPLKTFLVNFYTAHKETWPVIGANIVAIVLLAASFFLTQEKGFYYSVVFSLYIFQTSFICSLVLLRWWWFQKEESSHDILKNIN